MPALWLRKNFILGLIGVNLLTIPFIFFLNRSVIFNFGGALLKSALPIYAQMPSFELIERNGKMVTDRQMKKKIWVANFIFTRCPNECPLMTHQFSLLQKSLPDFVHLVSFSVDPAYDTPEKLQVYAKNYGAPEERWLFLTGAKETINQILFALHLANGKEVSGHSLRFVLLDEKLQLRGYYDSGDPQGLSQLKRDIASLRNNP
jgi:protein SCO1/2